MPNIIKTGPGDRRSPVSSASNKATCQCRETAFRLTDTTRWQQSNEVLVSAQLGISSCLTRGINSEDAKKQKKVNIHCKSVVSKGDLAQLCGTGWACDCYVSHRYRTSLLLDHATYTVSTVSRVTRPQAR